MKKLSKEDSLTLRKDADVIEADAYGDKVLLLTDGTYLKLFRRKRLFSTATLFPYSQRFAQNAKKLIELNIPTVSVIELYTIPTISRTAVHYNPLKGTTLRGLPKNIDKDLATKLGNFIRMLHDSGVYFRSLHMGNIVLTENYQLGLIDISDMKIYGKPLTETQRIRNFQHCSRYPEDNKKINQSINAFIDGYQSQPGSPLCRGNLSRIYSSQ
jgi:tRNA A-37 threonylcarbamoyl transferase component Bud32